MLDNHYYIKSGHPQGFTDYIQAIGTVTFAAGLATVTAEQFGLTKIHHVLMFPWGIPTGTGLIGGTTTAFVETGVDSVDLELVEDDGTPSALTCSVLAFGV